MRGLIQKTACLVRLRIDVRMFFHADKDKFVDVRVAEAATLIKTVYRLVVL